MYLQTSAFILNTKPWKERDRMYTLYTRSAGKLTVIGQGTRSNRSKLSGHMQLFNRTSVHIVRGTYWYRLIGAQTQYIYSITDTLHYGYGCYFLELIDVLTKEGQRHNVLFGLLHDALSLLVYTQNEQQLKKLRIAFLLQLLKATGFNPEKRIKRDIITQRELERFLTQPLKNCIHTDTNGTLTSLFSVSQYALNEVIEKPMNSVQYLQSV